jgi:DNA polymerase (family 10)
MEARAINQLDLVLGCFDSALRKKEDQTERYLAALRNRGIQILGHPQGRIYNFRDGLTAHWSRVFGLAAKLDKAIEIDSYPDRQDLSVDLLKIARKEGCRIFRSAPIRMAPRNYALLSLALHPRLKLGSRGSAS